MDGAGYRVYNEGLVRTLAVVLLVALPGAAAAETAAAVMRHFSGLDEDAQRRILRVSEVALRELSGFEVEELTGKARPPQRKGCASDPACLSTIAAATGADYALLMYLAVTDDTLFVDAFFVDVNGRKAVHRQIPEGRVDEPEALLRALVEAVLPAFGRKGWAGSR